MKRRWLYHRSTSISTLLLTVSRLSFMLHRWVFASPPAPFCQQDVNKRARTRHSAASCLVDTTKAAIYAGQQHSISLSQQTTLAAAAKCQK